MHSIVAIILGGGQGTRLFPLTRDRSKPAVPLAGKYRLIDIPISNCIHSNIRQIYVLTMYQSASLNSHVSDTFRFDSFSRGFVQVLAAEQTRKGGDWFQGTADAVRQSLVHVEDTKADRSLILSGDHLYRMDFARFNKVHQEHKADITIAVQPVTRAEAPGLGILKVDETGRIVKFVEKPQTEEALDEMRSNTAQCGLDPAEAERKPYLASMGMYLFHSGTLRDLLLSDQEKTDFGKHFIPLAIEQLRVQAYVFEGYWADIGTVGAFYEANMDLIQPLPRFNLFNPTRPIYTHPRYLPGAKVNRASVEGAVLCDGTIVDGAMVRDSILGVRSRVQPGATIERSLIMGADFYPSAREPNPAGIGEGVYLKKTIVDKNTCIHRGAQLVNRQNLDHYDDPEERFFVRDGVIVVAKGSVIPEGFVF